MELPIAVKMHWVVTENDIKARDKDFDPLPPTDPPSNIEQLITAGAAIREYVELVYEKDMTVANTCCLYMKVGGTWYCAKKC
jgi:hypothetical protein